MILAIDQGTTGSTCIVFDEQAEPIRFIYREFTQHFPKPGWVEHDAAEIWAVTQAVAGEALADAEVRAGELVAVGITNQRETVCVWDPSTGEPLHRAIVWQDRRTVERCEQLRAAGHEELVRARTGLVLDPYFSGTKIEWLLRNVDKLEPSVHVTARRCSARSMRGSSSSCAASTQQTPRTRRARCSMTSQRVAGIQNYSLCWRSPSGPCRAWVRVQWEDLRQARSV